MKLTHPLFSKPICFVENRIPVLTVENPVMFRSMLLDLLAQEEGSEGKFVLSLHDEMLECREHLHVINDYAHLDNMGKRIQTRFLSSIMKTAHDDMANETLHLSMEVQQYLGKLAAQTEYPIRYEETENLAAILKAMDVQIDFSGLTACEALYEHLAAYNRLMKHQCFVLVHAKSCFSEEELGKLYEMALYEKWKLMLLEAHGRDL